MLRDTIVRQGEHLFRHRGWVPLVLAPALLLALRDSEWLELAHGDAVDDVFDWLCLAVSGAGVALRVATVGYVLRRSSGRNTRKGQVADELNTTGLYSLVRHPLYLANSLILAGLALATGSFWFTALSLLLCCLHYERVACAEEEFLLERFGARYLAWAERTPAFLPRPARWVAAARPFCWRTALKREYQTSFAVILAFTTLDYMEDAVGLGRIALELEMTLLFAATLLVFLATRIVHKRTRWLRVAGR